MLKRIAGLMLALVMLTSALPVNTLAAEYEVGDIIYLPAGEMPGKGWEPVPGEGGMQMNEEVECDHDYHEFCLEYAWKYKGGVRQGTPTDMTVLSVDTEGNPLVGLVYMLYEDMGTSLVFVADAVTDENGVATFEDLCLTEERDTAQWILAEKNFMENPLSEIYRPNGGTWSVTISRDANGTHSIAVDGESVQDSEQDVTVEYERYTGTVAVDLKLLNAPEELQERIFNVTINQIPAETVEEDGADEEAAEEAGSAEEPFEPKVLELPISNLSIIQDKQEDLPLGRYSVTLDEEAAQVAGYSLTVTYETTQPSGAQTEDLEQTDAETDAKTDAEPAEAETEAAEAADGSEAVEAPAEEEAEETANAVEVLFDSTCTHTTVTITCAYTADVVETEPIEEEEQDTIISVVAVDDLNRPLEDAEFTLTDGEITETYYSDRNGTVEIDMADFAVEGEEKVFTLTQTAIPVGYELDETVYNVSVTEKDGRYTVDLEKEDEGFIEKVTTWFRGDNHDAHFCNHRRLARIKVYCEVEVKYHDAHEDYDFTEDCEEKKYEYILTYKDEDGKARERTLKLSDGDSEWFKEDLPYGTEYKVTAKDGKGYSTDMDENADNTITEDDLGEVIPVRVVHTYDVYGSDEDLELDFVKVDEKSKDPLPGATFVLKDYDDVKLATFETTKENEAEFTIKELAGPGEYTLKETEAPEGYYKLKKALVIDVFADYEMERAGDGYVYIQTLDAEVTGKGVKLLSDGTYRISNSLSSGNPETGDMFNPVLWIGLLGVSGMALAVLVIIGIKKKGKK